MIASFSSAKEAQTGVSMDNWLALLKEGKKSTQQLETEMLKGVTDSIKDMQKKAAEKAKEALKEEAQKTDEADDTTETTASTDEIKAPSEVTKADLESPIDIKL